MYTFASRQALRYDVVRLGNEFFNWNLQVVDKAKGTIQFRDDLSIEDSQEMDLFGYMKTSKKTDDSKGGSATREAVIRLSNAISLEPYRSDMDFLNNKGLADRINEHPNLANIEQHLSYYTYTITIDLEKIGKDKNVEISNAEKAKRVNQLLDIVKLLNREIRGREENLSPVFVVGGVYDINSPFFLGRIKIISKNGEFSVDASMLKDAMTLTVGDKSIYDDTKIGVLKNALKNEEELEKTFENKITNIENFFNELKSKVSEYYND